MLKLIFKIAASAIIGHYIDKLLNPEEVKEPAPNEEKKVVKKAKKKASKKKVESP